MIDGREIRIRTIHEAHETWLCLEGTILSYQERHWTQCGIVSIPIELIHIVEGKRFNGRRLIAAFLSLLLGFAAAGISLWLLSLVSNSEIREQYWGVIFGSCVLCGLVCFVVFLIRFFIRQSTITLCIAPENNEIDFWVQRRNSADIYFLVQALQRRKTMVSELIEEPIIHPVLEVLVHPWKQTAWLVFLFSIPAMIFEIKWMFLFGLIPLFLHGCFFLSSRTQPLAFRKAIKLILKGDRHGAVEAASKTIGNYPDFLPARLLKIQLLTGLEKFEEAQAVLEDAGRLFDWETEEQIRDEIRTMSRISQRKRWREHI